MTRRYDSFVLRCWQLGDEWRIEVEHLQSGGRTRSATLKGAADWIGERCEESDDQVPASRPVIEREEVRNGEERPAGEQRTNEAATDVPGRARA
jgi:hypothetical protein